MSVSPGDVAVVLITVPSMDVGEKIARVAVEEGLAACVNIVPGLRSIYSWHGRIEDESELLLLAKTRADRLAMLEARVRSLHPYSVPEFIVLPVVAGHEPYLAWVSDSVTTKGGGESDQE